MNSAKHVSVGNYTGVPMATFEAKGAKCQSRQWLLGRSSNEDQCSLGSPKKNRWNENIFFFELDTLEVGTTHHHQGTHAAVEAWLIFPRLPNEDPPCPTH